MVTTLTRSAARRPARGLVVALTLLGLTLGLVGVVPPLQAEAATCPCTVFAPTSAPANPAENDSAAVEVGMKFRADQAGSITGVRFYKGIGNTGTHTGSLWSRTGTRLATVTFAAETTTGWQQANFATPYPVTANTTYVISYFAPRGHYASDESYFANAAVVNSPLTALKNGTDGANGVYRYGTAGGFPNSSYRSSNYWVDPVFTASGTDNIPPTLTDRQPAAGATGVATSVKPTATFSESVQASTIMMTLSQGTTAVASTVAYDAATRVATLTPSAALAPSTSYTVAVSGAKDSAQNQMTPTSWSFTTGAGTSSSCPCSIWSASTVPSTPAAADDSAVELGVKFRANVAGYITGIRFYKGAGNTGTHVGSLWKVTGEKIGSVEFANESASGWQTATFSAPLPVSAGTTYVASYYAPVGRYAANGGYFTSTATTNGPLTALASGTDGPNGVYAYGSSQFPDSSYNDTNYWVDPVFNTAPSDTVAPSLVTRVPAPDSSGAPVNGTVRATFSEPVVAASVAMTLRGPGGAVVPASVTYDAGTQTGVLTPSAPLATSTAYTVTVSGARDTSNNTMADDTWGFTTAAPAPPGPQQGPGGPIAVVTSASNPYSTYLAEILRTEGLNEFATIDVGTLSASTLAGYDVVVLGNVTVSTAQADALNTWVTGGGNLIAMRPGANLSSLLGLTPASGTLANAYLKVDTSQAPGAGIVASSIQFHGTADKYTLSGATAVASLYSNATTATTNPAVTLRSVGSSGGQAAAFTYDLPQSVALTRQGNPAWAGTERDGRSPIRSDDYFFGGSSADWIDFSKVAIPQADEQQRLLANLVQLMNRDKKPLPRFWYFPKRGDDAAGAPNLTKAVLVGTGDDHGNNGTAGRFNQFAANSPAGCSVADWNCFRYSSYLWNGTPLTNAAAANYDSQGFEVGLHVNSNGSNYTPSSINTMYAEQMAQFKSTYTSVPNPLTTRMHAIVFSDWSSQPKAEIANGMRMDTNYYYWPDTWVQDRPGFMTGSGMAMRFTDTDGSMIDNYQAATQMTDESGQSYPYNIDTLLDNAQGPNGYYGSFVTNFHTDLQTEPESDALLASAKSHNVPIVSGRQLTNWLDGRNGSSYGNLAWSGNTLSFSVAVGSNATGLTGMLPTAGPNGTTLTAINKGGAAVPFSVNTIKGMDYATFNAGAGAYTATYGGGGLLTLSSTAAKSQQVAPTTLDTLAPKTAVKAGKTATSTTAQTATVSWQTNKPATSKVLVGTSPGTLKAVATDGAATRTHKVAVRGLKPKTTYYYRVASTDTTGQQVLSPTAQLTTTATDLVAAVATDPVVFPLPDGTARVTWTTDVPTAAGVQITEVGTTTVVERQIIRSLTTNHDFLIAGLAPNKAYAVRAVSQDLAGNRTISPEIRIATPAAGVAQASEESFLLGKTTGDLVLTDDNTLTLGGKSVLARQGTYESAPLDAHQMVDWTAISLSAQVPVGAGGEVSVRYGSTTTPDSTWSAWTAAKPGSPLKGSGRYVQYRVTMSAPVGILSPALYAVGFSHKQPARKLEKETE